MRLTPLLNHKRHLTGAGHAMGPQAHAKQARAQRDCLGTCVWVNLSETPLRMSKITTQKIRHLSFYILAQGCQGGVEFPLNLKLPKIKIYRNA